jgi:hypothetical protein
VWKTLHSGIAQAAPKGWEFPAEKGELTLGQLWADNKMDEKCIKRKPCGQQLEPQKYKEPSPHQTKRYAEPQKTQRQ